MASRPALTPTLCPACGSRHLQLSPENQNIPLLTLPEDNPEAPPIDLGPVNLFNCGRCQTRFILL